MVIVLFCFTPSLDRNGLAWANSNLSTGKRKNINKKKYIYKANQEDLNPKYKQCIN